jgi:hypothetical protein
MECAIVAHSGSGAFNGCMVKAGHSLDTGDHHWRWSLFYSKRITGLPLFLLASVEAPAHLRLQNPLPGAAIPGGCHICFNLPAIYGRPQQFRAVLPGWQLGAKHTRIHGNFNVMIPPMPARIGTLYPRLSYGY